MEIIKCSGCGKEYGYKLWGAPAPGGKVRGETCCPYYGEAGYSE